MVCSFVLYSDSNINEKQKPPDKSEGFYLNYNVLIRLSVGCYIYGVNT